MQIYLKKDNNPVALTEGTLLAVGGRYDYLLQDSEYVGVLKFMSACLHLSPLSLLPLNTIDAFTCSWQIRAHDCA